MKTLELRSMGLDELNHQEMSNTNGGLIFAAFLGIALLGFFIGLAIGLNNE